MITEEDTDEIVDKLIERLRNNSDILWCRRCEKRIGYEDPFILCVQCQDEIGSKTINKLKMKK